MTRAKRLVLSVALLGSAGFGCEKDNDDPVGPGQAITVYTRNLYLGSEITPLAAIPSPESIPGVAATLWANIQASDFPERAKVLADEIVALAPDLVALQEVTLYRRQIPGDFQPGDDVPNATEVVLDFLAILMAEIDARGGGYRVVGEALNVDAELPVPTAGAGLFDLRLTDRDVILARDTVQTVELRRAAVRGRSSSSSRAAPAASRSRSRAAPAASTLSVGDAHFTFGNAHLEIQAVQLVQTAQATEMLSGIASVPDPVLLLGDFNSEPGMNSYPLLTTQFNDGWDDAGGGASGFTCCQASNLMNPESSAGDRIDLVLYRGRFRVNEMTVTGTRSWHGPHAGRALGLRSLRRARPRRAGALSGPHRRANAHTVGYNPDCGDLQDSPRRRRLRRERGPCRDVARRGLRGRMRRRRRAGARLPARRRAARADPARSDDAAHERLGVPDGPEGRSAAGRSAGRADERRWPDGGEGARARNTRRDPKPIDLDELLSTIERFNKKAS